MYLNVFLAKDFQFCSPVSPNFLRQNMSTSYFIVATSSRQPEKPTISTTMQLVKQPPVPPNHISTKYMLQTAAETVYITLSVPFGEYPGTGVKVQGQTLDEVQVSELLQKVAMDFARPPGSTAMTFEETEGGYRTAYLECGSNGDWWQFWWQVVAAYVPA
jgi:hypothetical protein